MTVALDLGSSEFRSLRKTQQRLIAKRIPAVYCAIQDHPHYRRILNQARIPHSTADDSLIVMGESACEVARLVGTPLISIMAAGHFPIADPVGRQVCASLIETILPPAEQLDEVCGICLPAAVTYNRAAGSQFYRNILKLRGYNCRPLNPATAIAMAELDQNQMTGLVLVVGAESVAISLTDHGRVVFEMEYRRGLRSILQRFAARYHRYVWDQQGRSFYDLQGVQQWLIDAQIELSAPKSGPELWITKELRRLMRDAWMATLTLQLRHGRDAALSRRLPVVLAGGPVYLAGFPDLLSAVFRELRPPIHITTMRSSIFASFAVTRGLLIHAELTSGQGTAVLRAA